MRIPAWSTAASVGTGGVALALAFPRPDLPVLAWVGLVPSFVVAVDRTPRGAFGWGWFGGTAFFLILLRWLDYTFRQYSAIPWPLTWLPLVALAAYCGLYAALVCAAMSWLRGRAGAGLALTAAPALWVVAEWARGWLLGGFPWGLLGYSQYRMLPIIQVAELTGVYGVSFVIVAVNAALAGLLVLPAPAARRGLIAVSLLLGPSVVFGLSRLSERTESPETVSVALVQPSIDQPLKWNPAHQAQTIDTYLGLTGHAIAAGVDLVVWPETASPTVFRRDGELQELLASLAGPTRTPLLVGSIDILDGEPPRLSNSAFLFTDRGIVGRYDKMHLVPFGEYVPLPDVIGFVRSWAEFIAELEPGPGPVVFQGPPAPFGVVICYEGIFPELVREFVRGGARLLVNMTNDAWFGQTSGPLQHLAMYPLRAVEHRIGIARAANTGVSAFVAPTGRIERSAGLYTRQVLVDRLALRARETLFTRFGNWFVGGCAALGGTLGVWALTRRRGRAE
jgi:apolipoprotein N-acyltransferase